MLRRPLRVALLCGARAPGLERLLEASAGPGPEYRLVAAMTTTAECDALPALEEAGVPTTVHDIDRFLRSCDLRLSDRGARRAYDLGTVAILAPHRVDLVLLSAYLLVLSDSMLSAYPGRIVNVHDSDLTALNPDGRPRWRGLRSTRDAIAAGARETRSTIHVVTEEVDRGPVLATSKSFPVHPLVGDALRWGAKDMVSAYAYAQREWMMRSAWGDLMDRAARMYARGEVAFADVERPSTEAAAVATSGRA